MRSRIAWIFAAVLLLLLTLQLPLMAAGTFQLPKYDKVTLKNGLTVYLLEQKEVPLVYISMVFPAGSVKDGEQYGLASLTADGLLFGTENYSKKEIEEQLDFIGASFGTSASKEYSRLTMSFLNSDQDKVFPLLKEIVMHPVFDEQEYDKAKSRLLVNLERAKENPRQVMGSYYYKFLFGDHVYGNPTTGTVSSVTNLGVDNLKSFYKDNYTPKGSAIAIAGDFNTKDMKKAIEALFKDWNNKGKSVDTKNADIPKLDKSRVLLVNKDDATETRFMIGQQGIKRSNPDYIPIQVVNTIFGGRFTSWLMDELRTKRGLTYGAYSYFQPLKNSGIFAISSFTPTDSTAKALDVALSIVDKLHDEGVDEETLQSAKNYIKGQYPPEYETSGQLADLLTDMFIYDFDESFINTFEKNVDNMTTAKAKEIIQKYFPQKNLQFVLVGKADEIRDIVKDFGEVTEKDIKADGF